MTAEGDDALVAAARDLADGRPVDLDALERANPALRSALGGLRFLRELAARCAGTVDLDELGETLALTVDPWASPAGEMPEVPFSWGGLQAREPIGSGAFGQVFRAWDPALERDVALKLRRVDEAGLSDVESHLAEARRLASVRHPNVLAVHGVAVHDGLVGIWTDLLRGETLDSLLAREGPMPASELIRIGRQLARALASVHAAGLIHGDVKGANAMLDADGRAILMDFGAGSRARAHESGAATQETAHGTPLAMAPELLGGGRPSVASDLYAFGTLLYRLATGAYPIVARTWTELLEGHAKRAILPLGEVRPDLPEALVRAIDRTLAPKPVDRPASARELEWMLASGASPSTETEAALAPPVPGAPRYATRFVGRAADLAGIESLLLDPGLVSLVGAGGCGKTRIAERVAADAQAALPEGAAWVDLASLGTAEHLLSAALRALGVRESTNEPPRETLLSHLRGRTMLLVLDNCEHLLGASAELGEALTTHCPRLRVLTTSREALGIPGERVHRLEPLSVPPTGEGAAGRSALTEYEAVRLFVDRACRRRPEFMLTQEVAPSVARIVRRLDGLPLAIELAAARIEALSATQIADQLDQSFRLLARADRTGAAGDLAARQRTLVASIRWSYDLLAPEEATLLARLSLFVGGCTLEAAEAVCRDSAEGPPTIAGEEILDLLQSLAARSLVQFLEPEGVPPRYRLLEMVRAFAADRLAERGEAPAGRTRHCAYFRRFTASLETSLLRGNIEATMGRYDVEVDNVRAALAWAREAPLADPSCTEDGPDLCIGMRRYWYLRGRFREGIREVESLLAREVEPNIPRARLCVVAGSMWSDLGDLERSIELLERGIELQDELGDTRLGPSLGALGVCLTRVGRLGEARTAFDRGLAQHRETGDRAGEAVILTNLGVLEATQGELQEARRHYEAALAVVRSIGDTASAAFVLGNLANTAVDEGDLTAARIYADEGLALSQASGSPSLRCNILSKSGLVALAEGNLDEARRLLVQSLGFAVGAEHSILTVATLELLACVEIGEGNDALGARVLAWSDARPGGSEAPRDPIRSARLRSATETARLRMGEARFRAEWTLGRALSREQVVAFYI